MGLLDLFRPAPKLRSWTDLEDFLDSRSAFLVQKCVYEYSRARAGVLWQKLFKEVAFRAAMERSRWRNYPLCLENVTVMVEHAMRAHAGEHGLALRQGLIAAAGRVTARYPVPADFEPDFWAAARERIARRIDVAGLAAPHPIKDLTMGNTKEFFANLPIHESLRGEDYVLVQNNLRVNLCRAYEDFLRDADVPALLPAVLAGPPRVALPGGVDPTA